MVAAGIATLGAALVGDDLRAACCKPARAEGVIGVVVGHDHVGDRRKPSAREGFGDEPRVCRGDERVH